MRWDGIYDFDRGNERICLLPMAARRALDVAGIHVSLASWTTLAAEDQKRFASLGSSFRVSKARVAALVCKLGLAYRLEDPVSEPERGKIPSEVSQALGPELRLTTDDWDRLTPLDRYTLVKLASRDREAKARMAYREMLRRRSALADTPRAVVCGCMAGA